MTIPFVIDNQQHNMADVLNDLLRHHRGHSLDVAPRLLQRWRLATPARFPELAGNGPQSITR